MSKSAEVVKMAVAKGYRVTSTGRVRGPRGRATVWAKLPTGPHQSRSILMRARLKAF